MNKYVLTGLAAFLALGISGCTGETKEPSNQNTNATESEQANIQTATKMETEDQVSNQFNQKIDELKQVADKAMQAVDEAKPSGNTEEKTKQYLALENQLEAAEDQLDDFEDEIEAKFETNTISVDVYQTVNKKMEQLENKLDTYDQKLEKQFGMTD